MDETRPENRLKVLHRKLVLMVTDMKSLVEQARLAKINPDQVPLFQAMFPDGVIFRDKFYQTYEEMEGIATLNEIEFPTEKEKSLSTTIKRYYYEAVTIFNSFTKPLDSKQTAHSSSIGFFGAKSKLPKIRIPTFDGNPLAWPHFRDTYHSLVHQELNLSDMEKYHYLHSSITSEALALVQHIPFTEQGYNLAWETLKERYNNKRILASVYLKQLLDFKPISQPNIESYRTFLNVVADNINAFKRLDLPDATEFILFTLAIRCLDYKSREVFETQHIKEDFPRFSDLIQFIKDKCQVLELSSAMTSSNIHIPSKASALHSKPFGKTFSKTVFLASGQNLSSLPNSKQGNHETSTRRSSYGLQNDSCFICKGQHVLLKCPKFLNFSPIERFNSLKGFPGCRNHLSQRHTQTECKMPVTCHFCQGFHHSLLHFSDHVASVVAGNNSDKTEFVTQNRSSDSATIEPKSVLISASTHFKLKDPISSRNVLLSTAEVDIKDSENRFQRIRILIDPGAQTSLITEECAKKLGLSPTDCKNKNITGVGGIKFSATGHIICSLKPRTCSNARLTTSALIVQHIASQLPQAAVPFNILSYCQNLHLADPHFGQPGPIEFLLGADLYAHILKSGASKVGRTSLFKIKTIFGFIITGSYFSEEIPPFISLVSDSSPAIEQLVKRSWEIEEPEPQEYANKEHDISEKHFLNTYVRLDSGRFSVSLPFKASIGNFGPSRHLAEKRFYNLEIKLNKNSSLKKDYTTFMEEYEGLGHMTLVGTPGKYYIPHHCVIKEDSSTTKLRVVFDGSSKAGSLSLNEALLIGPKLQLDICDILLNFRLHSVVFTADISKMYRQILVHEEDRAYQHILWRSSTQAELKEFELNTQELKNAEASCYKLHQQYYFKDEITPDSEFTSIRLKRLSPFFDRLGVLRVGGRLEASDLPESAKHPIILPNSAHLSAIIVDHYHQEFLHPGPQLLQSLLRQKFWILASRRLVKKRIFKCLRCYKLRAKPSQPIMGNLPLLRFDQTRAFVNVGIDFAGPFMIKESRRRNAALGKAYLCLFVCLSTKALHLEIVSKLTTNAFLAAFDRFISRRGLPSHVITDCGTTFVGASRELKKMEELLQSNEHRPIVSRYLANKQIQWSFNPPYAPNFGGIWETGVKSTKYHLQRVARDSPFTFEELSTLFIRIEGIINSRPLCPLSSEPDDLNFLTPAHFLIGDSVNSRAEENVVDTHENRLTRWQLIQQLTQHFWSRCRMEYLNTLQQRTKWHKTTYTPSEGDLVLLWDKNQAPLEWPTARIVEIHPGNDLITRVVTVQLPNKKLAKRPLNASP